MLTSCKYGVVNPRNLIEMLQLYYRFMEDNAFHETGVLQSNNCSPIAERYWTSSNFRITLYTRKLPSELQERTMK